MENSLYQIQTRPRSFLSFVGKSTLGTDCVAGTRCPSDVSFLSLEWSVDTFPVPCLPAIVCIELCWVCVWPALVVSFHTEGSGAPRTTEIQAEKEVIIYSYLSSLSLQKCSGRDLNPGYRRERPASLTGLDDRSIALRIN